MLAVLDLFSGLGSFSLGLEKTGAFTTKAFCEIDEFCQRVLKKHWPDVPCFPDVSKLVLRRGYADVICGGFPCTDLSVAGKRAGLSGKNSGLYWELVRAIRMVRPKYVFVENVPPLLDNAPMGIVCGELAESGYNIEWDCVPAATIGAPHIRNRVWLVAHANGERRSQSPVPGEDIGNGIDNGSETESTFDAPILAREQVGFGGESRIDGSVERGNPTNAAAYTPNTASWGSQRSQHERIELEQRAQFTDYTETCGTLDAANAEHDGYASSEVGGSVGARQETGRMLQPEGCSTPRRPRFGEREYRCPDSFAHVRNQASWSAADPYRARLAFGKGIIYETYEAWSPAERSAFENGQQSIWPDEPALSGVDDDVANWLERTKATGNGLIWAIPYLIAKTIAEHPEHYE